MRARRPLTFETIPAWAIDADSSKSRHTIAAAIELAELTGKWFRLTAASQRELFGHVLFGKCKMYVDHDGIRAVRSVCFGTDFTDVRLTWDDVERHMTNGTRPIL